MSTPQWFKNPNGVQTEQDIKEAKEYEEIQLQRVEGDKRNNNTVKESLVIVLTGTLINYPLSLFLLWVFLDLLEINSVFWIGTFSTLVMTFVAFIRVYYIRGYYDSRYRKCNTSN